MLKIKVIGVGFGGTHAAITACERFLGKENTMIVNSTKKDIPLEYEDIAACYSRAYGGSAKERSTSKELCLDALRNDQAFIQKIDGFVDPDTEVVVLVAASEGGTGSGSLPILAKYFSTVVRKAVPKLRIEIFSIDGFRDDGRGMQNTIEFYQDIEEEYTVQALSLKKYLDEGLTRSQAEQRADDEFAKKIAIMAGAHIEYSGAKHNIDESDLLKLSTTPGYMFTFRVSFSKLKNTEEFNKLVEAAIDNDKSLDIPKQTIARLGVITNLSEKSEELVDYKFPSVRNKLGTYYELFTHDNAYDGQEEYIDFIAAGLQMPIDELKEVYESYQAETQNVSKEKDNFFAEIGGMRGDTSNKMFDVGANKKLDDVPSEKDLDNERDSFLKMFEIKEEPVKTEVKKSIEESRLNTVIRDAKGKM